MKKKRDCTLSLSNRRSASLRFSHAVTFRKPLLTTAGFLGRWQENGRIKSKLNVGEGLKKALTEPGIRDSSSAHKT